MRDLALAIFVCVALWMLTDVIESLHLGWATWDGFVPVGAK